MPKWVSIAKPADLADGGKVCANAENVPVTVCQVEGKLFAFQNVCPHAGLPLGEGPLAGKAITCPFHGYTYNVETGKNIDFADDIPLLRYPVKVEGDQVLIDLEAGQ